MLNLPQWNGETREQSPYNLESNLEGVLGKPETQSKQTGRN